MKYFQAYIDNSNFTVEKDNSKAKFCGIALPALAILINLFGIVMLYSTSYGIAGSSFVVKQIIWMLIGITASFSVYIIGYRNFFNLIPYMYLAICILLIFTIFTEPVKGAQRWIKIPGIGNLQPSEFAKIILVFITAKYCSKNIRTLNRIFKTFKRNIFFLSIILFIPLLLILFAGDLGTTILIGLVVLTILFAAGLKIRFFVLAFLCAFPFIKIIQLSSPERWSRIKSFLNPEAYLKEEGYQLWNSIMALGSGGWFGIGFTKSRMKEGFLPEAHTDFIMAIVGEELGLSAVIAVIFLYSLIMFSALIISLNARTKQASFLALGLASTIILQAVINIGVVSGALPTKGMPAPFISYGGSNLLMCYIAVGLIVSVAFDYKYQGIDFKSLIKKIKKIKRQSS